MICSCMCFISTAIFFAELYTPRWRIGRSRGTVLKSKTKGKLLVASELIATARGNKRTGTGVYDAKMVASGIRTPTHTSDIPEGSDQ